MNKTFVSGIFEKFYILMGTMFVLLPVSPMNAPYSLRDSGVFLYIGWRILKGELPYLHVWDHKPPMVFFLNSLGLSISNNSTWGVWIIQLLSLFFAAYLGYNLLKRLFGVFSAVISTFIWLLALFFILRGGNLTTEYTLPIQFAALWIFWLTMKKKNGHLNYFLIGILGGVSFLFKQTSIGLWFAISIFLLVFGIKKHIVINNITNIILMLFGGLFFFSLVSVYFIINNGFLEFLDAAFLFNILYSSSGRFNLLDRLMNFVLGFDHLTISTIFQYAMLGLVLFIFRSKLKRLDEKTSSLLNVALISIPIELIFINLPGFTYPHYFITILPVLALFVAVLFYFFEHWISESKVFGNSKLLAVVLILGFTSLGTIKGYMMLTQDMRERINEPVIQYVIDNSEPDDSILLWGAETMVNFFSQRKSPTRYVYQLPLYTTGYTSEERILEFLDDIIENQPRLIIDTKSEQMPIFQFPIATEQIDNKINFISSSYSIIDEIDGWQIYQISQ